jgi:hypothetical protein
MTRSLAGWQKGIWIPKYPRPQKKMKKESRYREANAEEA